MRPTIVVKNKDKRLGKPYELADAAKKQLDTEGGEMVEPADGIFDANISESDDKPEESISELRKTIRESKPKIDDSSM
jgi:hypothetical protein